VEFLDALARMEHQAQAQRRDALVAKSREGGLTDAEKTELRALLAAKHTPVAAPE
jgi:DNA primase